MTCVENSSLWMCGLAGLPRPAVSRVSERLRQSPFTHGIAPGSTTEQLICLFNRHARTQTWRHASNTPEAPDMSKTSQSRTRPPPTLAFGTSCDWSSALGQPFCLAIRLAWTYEPVTKAKSLAARPKIVVGEHGEIAEEVEEAWCEPGYAVEGE